MNKIKKLIGIIMCALVLTGCELKYEGKVEIIEDGKMDMSVIMAYDRELVSNLIYMEKNSDDLLGNGNTTPDETDVPEASITEIRKYLEENKPEEQDGLEVSRYERNGYYGYQMSMKIDNIDEVSSKDDVESSLFDVLGNEADDTTSNDKDEKIMMFKKDGDTYYAKYKINDDSNNSSSMNLSMLDVNLEYTVTLPTKPIKHNADTVSEDGKTLTWQLDGLDSEIENIEYSFKLKDTISSAANGSGLNTEMIMLIAGIVIIVIIIIVVLVLFARNNRKLDKSLEALDQTIPSGAPKPSTPVVENNVVPTPTVQPPIEPAAPVVTQTVENIVEPQNAVSKIEVIPVVENIPVTNTENIEQNNVAPVQVQVEEKVTPVETTTPNIEEMPIIMEPSVVIPVQNNIVPEEQINTTSEVVNTEIPQEPVSAFEQEVQITPENVTETIETAPETPVINGEPVVTNIVEEPNVIETPLPVEASIQVAEPVVEKIEEPVATPVQEANIFDTPNMSDVSVKLEETPVISETPVNEINNVVPTIETITPKPVATNVVEQPNIMETPLTVETSIPEVNEEARVETVTINDTPTVSPEPVIPTEPIKVTEENIETPIENVITTETIETINPVNAEQPTIEEPKLEVLENNTTLEEPDIPLPELKSEEPISEVQTLEEAPKVEEPTGNRFIQTDFIENRKEEPENNNTNI